MILIFILLLMLFMHYIGDYILQTEFISKAKCKEYWKNDKYSYIPILFFHSLEYSVCIHLPLLILLKLDYQYEFFSVSIILNAVYHYIIDYLKANKKSINLLEDQMLHLCQIIVTLFIAFIYFVEEFL